MCRTGRVFRPEVEGRRLSFRLVGAVYRNAILEDAATGSWWYQATGRAAAGPLAGERMPEIPFERMTLGAWRQIHPESDVMVPDPASEAGYHIFGFDSFDGRRPDPTDPIQAEGGEREWVVTVRAGNAERGYSWSALERSRLIVDDIAGIPVAVLLHPDGGSLRAFDRRLEGRTLELTLAPDGVGVVDAASGTRFGFDGVGSGGSYDACVLSMLPVDEEFGHSVRRFHPAATR